ncbi:MAG: hypothetical protein HOP17_07445 [Acidobacteria bacterium]|nr:hypothetical protein [Acidobacteriota bacterium]
MAAAVAPAQWRRIETGSLAWFHAVEFINETNGWVGGSNGTLLFTTDGGSTWRKAKFPNTDTIRDIVFLNASAGWMLCERSKFGPETTSNRSYLMRTADGGKSWSEVNFEPSAGPMTKIFFGRKGEGYAVGEGGVMAAFSVGGPTEKRYGLPTRYLILDGVVLNNSRLVLVGGGGSIISSDDKGAKWQAVRFISSRPTSKLNAIAFVDEKRGWAVGNEGTVLSSTDGGTSWLSETTGASSNLLDILFCNAEYGFAVGENGIILNSFNAGRTWKSEASGSKHRLERLANAGNKLFAVGFGGTILVRDIADKQRQDR